MQNVLANSHDAVVETQRQNRKIQIAAFCHLGARDLTSWAGANYAHETGASAVDKPRRLRKALRTRENDLRKLLANALDAVVVTDDDHRFVAANPKALDLFGVSETNSRNFTIDAFLPRGQILYFDGNGSPFIGREERHGECKIRRMDGSLRAAEYSFVANFVPRRHLCRFHNVKTTQIKLFAEPSTRPRQ